MKRLKPPAGMTTNETKNAVEAMKDLLPKYDFLASQKTRRFIKTHLPFNLMPHNIKEVGAKVVYVARNPKDVAASYYNFLKFNPNYQFTEDFDAFLQYFVDDLSEFPLLLLFVS